MQDIEPYLKILKDKEPGLITYCVEWTASMFSSPVYEEVIPQTGVVIRKDSTDYKAEILVETPEYKEGVKTLGDWYQKGYIREDVNSVLENETDLKAGKYGVYQARIKPGAESEIKLKYGKDSIIIPIEEPYLIANAGITTMTAIGRTSKYPTQALQNMNVDGSLLACKTPQEWTTTYGKVSDLSRYFTVKYVVDMENASVNIFLDGTDMGSYAINGVTDPVKSLTEYMTFGEVKPQDFPAGAGNAGFDFELCFLRTYQYHL